MKYFIHEYYLNGGYDFAGLFDDEVLAMLFAANRIKRLGIEEIVVSLRNAYVNDDAGTVVVRMRK